MPDRSQDFKAIRDSLEGHVMDETPKSICVLGNSLELLRSLPDQSVSLILTDPPYHSTKKSNITGDTSFEEDHEFLEWMKAYAVEWKRVLKLSGTLYVFCASQMSGRLEVNIAESFKPIAHVTWTKPNEPGYDGWKGKMNKTSLRTWYPHSERILMFEQGTYGSSEAYRRSPMGRYLLDSRKRSGLTMVALTEMIGAYGKVNRGGAVANWEAGRNIPNLEQYEKLKAALEEHGVSEMLEYEDLIRPMNVSKNVPFEDSWNFMSVRPFAGKHPAEKPQDMLLHMIEASSYPGDIVLDCFAGSGSSGVAALRLGRHAVCMEIEPQWVRRAATEMAVAASVEGFVEPIRMHRMVKTEQTGSALDSLFD